jgi:hypothetical protein
VVSGSRIASRGNSGKSAISIFTFSSGTLITAAIETSLPVPAVVGMQASGAMSSGRPMPSSSRGIRKKPSWSRASPPWVNTAAATFAVSITDPPPIARNESAPAPFAAEAHSSHTRAEESCGTWSNTPTTSSPPSVTPAATRSTSPVPRTISSVTMKTRRAPSFWNSKPVDSRRSRPEITRVGLAYW